MYKNHSDAVDKPILGSGITIWIEWKYWNVIGKDNYCLGLSGRLTGYNSKVSKNYNETLKKQKPVETNTCTFNTLTAEGNLEISKSK